MLPYQRESVTSNTTVHALPSKILQQYYTIEPVWSGHPLGIAEWPLNTGLQLDTGSTEKGFVQNSISFYNWLLILQKLVQKYYWLF